MAKPSVHTPTAESETASQLFDRMQRNLHDFSSIARMIHDSAMAGDSRDHLLTGIGVTMRRMVTDFEAMLEDVESLYDLTREAKGGA